MAANHSVVVVGIDIGSESTKVVLGPRHGCEIVRNDVGGHTTPTAISLASRQPRQIGSTAQSKNAAFGFMRLLQQEQDESENKDFDKSLLLFGKFEISNKKYQIKAVDYNNQSDHEFSSSAMLAMLLGKIQTNVQSTLKRILGENGDSNTPHTLEFEIILPPNTSESAREQLLDAAYASGLKHTRLVDVANAYQSCYERKFPPSTSDGTENSTTTPTILVVDMGKTQTTVSVLGSKSTSNDDAHKEEEKTEESAKDEAEKEGEAKAEAPKEEEDASAKASSSSLQVLSSVHSNSLGAGWLDVRLCSHFQTTLPAVESAKTNVRAGQRLLEGCQKLKHLLSQLHEGTVTVENIQEGKDIKLTCTRKVFADLCQEDAAALTELILKGIQEANVTETSKLSIEITGGGCRIPWVKETVVAAAKGGFPNNDITDATLAYSFDDTSAALGAALCGQQQNEATTEAAEIPESETRLSLKQAEESMKAVDQEMSSKAERMNQLEAHVLELRSAKHDSKHGKLIDAEKLDAYLNQVEDWIFSEEADNATLEDMEAKWQETLKETNELAKDYLEAKQAEQAAKDAEMEAQAKQAQKEAEAEGDGEEDDHDNRRLPKKRRMEIVMKNKAEANELFGDGNFKFAAARYTKALSHCAKFVDLSPEDVAEVNAVKLSLNLNLALAYLKLENPDQALRVCNEAISIDDQSTKALYRRASAYYEKKNWDLANKDVKAALKIAPDDKATKKLQQKIEAQIQRQKQKEKKMAQKMFG